ncbi:hypothetical protein [Streptomyces sp. NPDC002159]
MSVSKVKYAVRLASVAAAGAALVAFGSGTASASDWDNWSEGAYIYAGPNGTGEETVVDLGDFGTCHTLSAPAASVVIINGDASLVFYQDAGCTSQPFATGSLFKGNLVRPVLSYQVVKA